MKLSVTPVILSFNEEDNLPPLLARLRWAPEVVLVDSGSTDATLAIASAEPNVRVVHNAFRDFASQWEFALHEAGVATPWVLTLDADYRPDDELLSAIANLPPDPGAAAYRVRFTYCIDGRALRGSLYPPREVLLHRERVRFRQKGHTHVVRADGPVEMLAGRMLHDDRKPVDRWLHSQWRYAQEEAALIADSSWSRLSWSGRARKLVIPAPPLAFLMALVVRGGLLDGWPGLHYAMERLAAEALIALALIRRHLGTARS